MSEAAREPPSSSGAAVRRLAKSLWRRGAEALDRARLRADARTAPRPRIAAAVTGRFPLWFHGFAYQELLSLREHLGADVKVFHLLDGDRSAVDPAFAPLLHRATKLPNAREIWRRDLAFWQRAAPARCAGLLEAIASAAELTVDALLRDDAVLQAFSFARKARIYGADYVHTYFFYAESLSGFVAQQLLGVPRGITAYADHALRDWHLKVVPLHLATADLVVATSRRAAAELRALAPPGAPRDLLVKPNGVDGRRFPFRPRTRAPGAPLELVSVSRLEPKKGLLELVDVAAELVRLRVPVRVHIAGGADQGRPESESYARELRARIDRARLREVCTLHGTLTQAALLPLLHRAHLFVAPYVETEAGDKDGIPTAMLEAMSTGLGVVATDAGAIAEVIDDGVEGRIVPQRDAAAMARAIAALAADAAAVTEMGARARRRFEVELDASVTERALAERVQGLLRSRDSSARPQQ